MNNTKPETWKSLHKKQQKENNSSTQPGPGAYAPQPSYFVFDKTFQKKDEEPMSKTKQKLFGGADRFLPQKKFKDMSLADSPGPAWRSLIVNWPGKMPNSNKSETTKKDWNKSITKGIDISLYYES